MPKVIDQTDQYNYEVATRPLYDLTQAQIEMLNQADDTPAFAGVYGNFRENHENALGIVTERYALVQNSDVVNHVEDSLKSRGLLDEVEKDFKVVDHGKRFYARYTIKTRSLNSTSSQQRATTWVSVSLSKIALIAQSV